MDVRGQSRSSSETVWSKAFKCPRCRPDGEVVVDSFHFAKDERKSDSVISGVGISGQRRCIEWRSLSINGSNWVELKVPSRIVEPVLVNPLCVRRSERGGTVNGVPCAC